MLQAVPVLRNTVDRFRRIDTIGTRDKIGNIIALDVCGVAELSDRHPSTLVSWRGPFAIVAKWQNVLSPCFRGLSGERIGHYEDSFYDRRSRQDL